MEYTACNRCGETKEFTAAFFPRTANKKVKSGLVRTCKICTSAQRKSRYQKNKKASHESTMKWRRANREKYNAYINSYKKEQNRKNKEY